MTINPNQIKANALFRPSDATGTKTVWHNGLIVDDRGNTATISKEATGTFTNSTEINSVAL